ncbi:MAG: putative S-layer protein [archaeon]
MKNKLLTSILAIMLVLVTGVSALDATVNPTTVNMAENTPLADAVTLTVTLLEGENISSVKCTGESGEYLTIIAGNGVPAETGVFEYKPDITPDTGFSGETFFTCTVDIGTEQKPTEAVSVNVAEKAPTIEAIDNKKAVENEDFEYLVTATDDETGALTYSLTSKPSGMNINSGTGLITWTPDNDQLGERTVVVQVTDTKEASATQEFTIEVRPKKVCRYGELDGLDITVDNPDNGDDFKAGDDINIEINVENTGDDNLDVIVRAMLYDLNDGKQISSVESDRTKIKDGDDENFDLTLEVPTSDWDEGSDFMVYITAYEDEDEQCSFEQIPVELTRENDDVIISELTLFPETAAPGEQVTATVTVTNIGDDDQDNTYIKLRNSYLNLMHETENFDLEDYASDDNELTRTITFKIPEDATTGDYWIDAVVYFDSGDQTDSLVAKLTVTGGSANTISTDYELPELEIAQEGIVSVKAGNTVAVPIVIGNTGENKATFTLQVSNVDGWANVMAIEQPDTLNAGEEGHAYVYLEVSEDAAIGVHEFSLNARNDIGLLATKKVSVTVEGLTAADTPAEGTNQITGWTTAGSTASNVFYGAGAVVLALIGLFFLRMLFKK